MESNTRFSDRFRLEFTARLSVVLLTLFGCTPLAPKPSPVNPPIAGASCKDVCVHLGELECDDFASDGADDIAGTEDDVACDVVCDDFIDSGMDIKLGCIVAADSCAAVDACDDY